MNLRNFKVILVAAALTFSSSISHARVFTNTEGRKISAKLVGATSTHVTLRLISSGKVYVLPIEKLSKADQEYIGNAKEALDKIATVTKIVSYTNSQKGKQVGNGECWTLADMAFQAAKAERPGPRVWGRIVDWKNEPVLPGDILELETATFKSGTTTGPNHTAVIMAKGDAGKCSVYEQNVGGKKIVMAGNYNLKELLKGKAIVYRYD